MRFLQKHLFLTATHKDIFFPFPSPFFVCTRNVCANKAAVAALSHPFNKDAPAAICPSQPTAHFNLYNGCAFVSPI